jgi:transposase
VLANCSRIAGRQRNNTPPIRIRFHRQDGMVGPARRDLFRADFANSFERISVVDASGSLELNPAEQVWQLLRHHNLANRCYESYDNIIDPCCDAWNQCTQTPAAVGSLCTRNWADLAPI